MKTRSQTNALKTPLYEVKIDFDAASAAWKSNKKSIGNGSYKYVCCETTKKGSPCNNKCLPFEDYCKTHIKQHLPQLTDAHTHI